MVPVVAAVRELETVRAEPATGTMRARIVMLNGKMLERRPATGDRAHFRNRGVAMHGQVGDRLVLEGIHVGIPRRIGVIISLRHQDGTPPYDVRWLDTGEQTLVFPGSDGRIEAVHAER
jgi:hypothetical protein